jgi:SAM-dependent methyltransferase
MVRFEERKMNLETFQELLSMAGRTALAEAMALEPVEASFLSCYEKLRRKCPAPLAKAAVETAISRGKAVNKFTDAVRMFFTREALEQSSGELPASYRARRFSTLGEIADLCCGIGGDTLAFARAGLTVHGVERDPIRAAMAKANAAVCGLQERIHIHEGDATTIPLPATKAAFADPSRRSNGQRHLDPEDYTPSLSAILAHYPAGFPLAVKIAPGVAWNSIADLDAEVEFVSVDGELKECVLWFGPLHSAARRATVLPSGSTLFADNQAFTAKNANVQEYVFDPDPAVVRAGLAGQLAKELGIESIDSKVAIFTGREAIGSPFLTSFRVEWATRFHLAKLREHLNANQVGRVTMIKRGSSIDSDEMMRKLKLTGGEHRVVILARLSGVESMIVGEKA